MEDENKRSESRSFWDRTRSRTPFSFLENIDDDWDLKEFSSPSGLSVSEDEQIVYVEAALPGIQSSEIDIIYDKGILWIKAEKREVSEEKRKKYYRKAMSAFSYRIAVPGDIDESKQPEALCKNGVLKVIFSKTEIGSAKKIPIREG